MRRWLSNNRPSLVKVAPCRARWCVLGSSRGHSKLARNRQARRSRIRCYRIQCIRMEPRKPTGRPLSQKLSPGFLTSEISVPRIELRTLLPANIVLRHTLAYPFWFRAGAGPRGLGAAVRRLPTLPADQAPNAPILREGAAEDGRLPSTPLPLGLA